MSATSDTASASTSSPASMVVPERVLTVSAVRYCAPGTTSFAEIEDRNESKKKANNYMAAIMIAKGG